MIFSYQKPLSGKRVGVVFGSFAPLHQGHLDLIYRAKKENDGGCIVIVCGYDGDKGEPMMPHAKRYRYPRCCGAPASGGYDHLYGCVGQCRPRYEPCRRGRDEQEARFRDR